MANPVKALEPPPQAGQPPVGQVFTSMPLSSVVKHLRAQDGKGNQNSGQMDPRANRNSVSFLPDHLPTSQSRASPCLLAQAGQSPAGQVYASPPASSNGKPESAQADQVPLQVPQPSRKMAKVEQVHCGIEGEPGSRQIGRLPSPPASPKPAPSLDGPSPSPSLPPTELLFEEADSVRSTRSRSRSPIYFHDDLSLAPTLPMPEVNMANAVFFRVPRKGASTLARRYSIFASRCCPSVGT